jgi:putative membrane protein
MKWHLGAALAGVLAMGASVAASLGRADEKAVTNVTFLADVLTRSAYEVKASELALTRAKAQALRQFARKIIAQERALEPAVQTLAVNNDVPLEFNRAKGRRQGEARLAEVPDDRFDRAFLQDLARDLKQWIDLAQRCATGLDGVAERELAANMLPTLRQRLQEANRLLKTAP